MDRVHTDNYLIHDIEHVKSLVDNTFNASFNTSFDSSMFKLGNIPREDKSVYLDVPNFMDAPELSNKISNKINICIFTINNNEYHPYLTFLCHKNNKKLSMIGLNINININKNKEMDVDIDSVINSIIEKFTYLLNCDEDQLNYAGYTMDTNTNTNTNTMYTYIFQLHDKNVKHNMDNYEWVTCWELINSNSVYDTLIDQYTIDFFTRNPSLLYLYDKNDVRIENPIVAYKQIKQSDIYSHTGSFNREKNIVYGLNMPHDRFFFYSSYDDCIEPNSIIKRILLFGNDSFIPKTMNVITDNDHIFRNMVSYLFDNKLIYALGTSDYIVL